MKKITITANIDKDALDIIDLGSDEVKRSRSNFIQVACVEKALELLKKNGKPLPTEEE